VNPFLGKWAKLYSNPTPAELALEPAVASLGVRYRFQHPLWALSLFPDFVLPDYKIVIEVDDPGHRKTAQRRKDAERTARLRAKGWTVVRCENDDALSDPYGTVDRILAPFNLTTRKPNQ
jgi:very-short-patch-repair endonuclease